MKLKLISETISANGGKDVARSDFEKDELLIGRDVAADIRIESKFASLKHAKFYEKDAALVVEDLGSLSGTIVNHIPVQRQVLKAGDELSFGDCVFKIEKGNSPFEVVQIIDQTKSLDVKARIARDAAEWSVSRALNFVRPLSLKLMAVIAIGFFVFPFLLNKKSSWSGGPLSINHRILEQNCGACHDGDFSRVKDEKCLACHQLSPHPVFARSASTKKLIAGTEPACVDCHFEHRGDHQLVAKDSRQCADCHASKEKLQEALGAKSEIEVVEDFDSHPDFKLPAVDIATVKLNHKIHMQPDLRTRTGNRTLTCSDCHKLSTDRQTIVPMKFDEKCGACHVLSFDERLPGVEVPHANTNEVFKFLYAEYAKFLLKGETIRRKDAESKRPGKIPGKSLPEAPVQVRGEFSRRFVEENSRRAEEYLMTGITCNLCHEIRRKTERTEDLKKAGLSLFEVRKANMPARWMPDSAFSHGAHEAFDCTSCHEKAKDSTQTGDVLLPQVGVCRQCHSSAEETSKIKSDCMFCHAYHESLDLSHDKKQDMKKLLNQ